MDAMSESSTTSQIAQNLAGKYLTFSLSSEHYGLEILKIVEIIGLLGITKVPRCPEYIKGVINLRGQIIPVVDLRSKFQLGEHEYDARTCIIVANVHIDDHEMNVGMIVDTVHEVFAIDAHQISPSPDYGKNLDTEFILGMGRLSQEQVVILIDIDRVLTTGDCQFIKEAMGLLE